MMLDTIALTLNQSEFSIVDQEQFSPPANLAYSHNRSVIRCYRTPTKKELKQKRYIPKLTLTARPFKTTLRVEFSIPKLIYGNNFEEVTNDDFPKVATKLKNTLENIGVKTSPDTLVNASVSLIHYSKNIVFTDYTTPQIYIRELNKVDFSQMLDFNQTDFRNGGHSVKFRANSFEFAVYDKVKDLQKAKISSKRSEEKDNEIQLELLNLIGKKHQKSVTPFEVLRLEARLNKRRKIREIIEKVDSSSELTFHDLFKATISQKVIHYYLAYILDNQISFDEDNSDIEYFTELQRNYPNYSLAKKTQLLGANVLIQKLGVQGYRQMVSPDGKDAWYRQKKILKESELPRIRGDPMDRLIQEVTAFETVKLSDYPQFQL